LSRLQIAAGTFDKSRIHQAVKSDCGVKEQLILMRCGGSLVRSEKNLAAIFAQAAALDTIPAKIY
jgi:hypothetical protein